jgi:hypothetical protein
MKAALTTRLGRFECHESRDQVLFVVEKAAEEVPVEFD